MRLTVALLKRKMPHGNIWRGKDRMHHNIFPQQIQQMENRLRVEERNMFLLRHPYLSVEQEKGHSKALGLQKERMQQKLLEYACYKVKKSVRTEDRLSHLLVHAKWEM